MCFFCLGRHNTSMLMWFFFSSASPPRIERRLVLRGEESMSMRNLSILVDNYVAFAGSLFVATPSTITSTAQSDDSAAFADSSTIERPSMMTSPTLGNDSAFADSLFFDTPTTAMPSSSVLSMASNAGKHPLLIFRDIWIRF
jgi:hypothetical protein